jgi:hypothetical protein
LQIFCSFEISDLFLRSRDGEPLFIKKSLDFKDEVKILPAVETLKRPRFVRLDHPKLRLPVSEDMGFEAGDPAHFPYPIVEPFGDDHWF